MTVLKLRDMMSKLDVRPTLIATIIFAIRIGRATSARIFATASAAVIACTTTTTQTGNNADHP